MASMTARNIVKTVEPRTIKAGTPDQRTVYDVIDNEDVKWTAWEKDTAEAAWKLKGVTSVWSVKVEQNGKYTNRSLINIEPEGNQSMHDALESTALASGFPKDVTHPEDPKDDTIIREVAAKVAAQISTNPFEFWDNCAQLAIYFKTGRMPETDGSAYPTISPAVQAELDRSPFVTPPDDDIPF